MSFHLINSTWSARGLTPAQKLVLLNLADRADKDGFCFPGHKLISEGCGVSLRWVGLTLLALKAAGHITINQETGRASKGSVIYSYIVHPVTPEQSSPVTPEQSSPVTHELGGTDTSTPRHRHPNSTASTHELNGNAIYRTPKEPSKNRQGEPDGPPEFEPVKRGLYPREYDNMKADCREEIKKIKADPANYAKDPTKGTVDLIDLLKRENPPDLETRIKEVLDKPASYERTALKPNSAAHVEAWRKQIKEIDWAKKGRKA